MGAIFEGDIRELFCMGPYVQKRRNFSDFRFFCSSLSERHALKYHSHFLCDSPVINGNSASQKTVKRNWSLDGSNLSLWRRHPSIITTRPQNGQSGCPNAAFYTLHCDYALTLFPFIPRCHHTSPIKLQVPHCRKAHTVERGYSVTSEARTLSAFSQNRHAMARFVVNENSGAQKIGETKLVLRD